MAGTVYVILKEVKSADGPGESYTEIGAQEAGSDVSAIRAFLAADDNGEKYGEGNYRAVPKRSWPDEPASIRKKISFG